MVDVGGNIFKTKKKGKVFRFVPDDNKEIDVYTLLKETIMQEKDFQCLDDAEKKSKLKMSGEFITELILFTGQEDLLDIGVTAREIRKLDTLRLDDFK